MYILYDDTGKRVAVVPEGAFFEVFDVQTGANLGVGAKPFFLSYKFKTLNAPVVINGTIMFGSMGATVTSRGVQGWSLPSITPTIRPTKNPNTKKPTSLPTFKPSKIPTVSLIPTGSPTCTPSFIPTISYIPTSTPTFNPSSTPTYSQAPSTMTGVASKLDWYTASYNNQRNGLNPYETKTNTNTVQNIKRKWIFPTVGSVLAQPVTACNFTMPSGRDKCVAFFGDESGYFYVIDNSQWRT